MANSRRVTVTLPAHVLDDLDLISSRLQISRSALISTLLGEMSGKLSSLAELIPADVGSSSDAELVASARRLRGASVELIQNELGGLLSDPEQGGLF